MEEENRETGIAFSDIVGIVKRRWLPVLISTVLLTAVLVAAFLFLLNPHSADYVMQFTLSYPGSGTLKYPDGSPFYFEDVISEAALAEAKASDGRFLKVNVEKMIERDDITLTPETAETDGALSETGKYTIAVKSSYFSDKATATAFLRAVGNVALRRIHEKAASVSYLIDYAIFGAATYEDRLSLLAEQKNGLLRQYDEWIDIYRENYSVAGKTLRNHRAEAAIAFGDVTQQSLTEELKTYGYVSEAQIEERVRQLNEEKSENETKLRALKEALAAVSGSVSFAGANPGATVSGGETSPAEETPMGLSETIAALIVRNVEIDSELEALTPERVNAFEARIESEYNKLKNCAETIKAVSVALYEQEARVIFATSRAEREGGTSILLVAVGGLILFFVVSSAVACLIELPKARRSEEGPAGPEADRE